MLASLYAVVTEYKPDKWTCARRPVVGCDAMAACPQAFPVACGAESDLRLGERRVAIAARPVDW